MVHYNQKSLDNILSPSHIDNMNRVAYNSDKEKAFIVHGTNSGNKNSSEVQEAYITTTQQLPSHDSS